MKNRGLYVHIPFCKEKCAYCDFYSLPKKESLFDAYCDAIIEEAKKIPCERLSTLYLGGGTPTLLGAERLENLISFLNHRFGPFKEATLEANPAENLEEIFKRAKKAGITRVSLGAQSGNENELKFLNRRHSVDDIKKAVSSARNSGIDNISLDLMLGIPEQTRESLKNSIDFITDLKPQHISSYMLSLGEGTPLYQRRNEYNFPCEEETAELYLFAVEELSKKGYEQYEISNFCRKNFSSLHNLNYWNCGEYYCLGPSAHGFIDGTRYCYENDLKKFIENPEKIKVDEGGNAEEYLMLRLRLNDGVVFSQYERIYGKFPEKLLKNAVPLKEKGLLKIDENRLSLTREGFLLFNEIFIKLLS